MIGKIWIVDDDQSILEALKIVLEQNNFRVQIISSGHKFRSEIKKEMPDLILLDIYIANINGRDLVKELKTNERTKNIPIVLTTADIFAIKNAKKDRYRADRFLPKPFALSEFMTIIDEYLKKG